MPALIDTHTFLWMASDELRLGPTALAYVKDRNNRLLLSIASGWEIAIKVGNGRLAIGVPLQELLLNVPARLGITLLPISPAHLVTVASLPKHHNDPFDRLLVAQCLVESIPFVSADAAMDAYGIHRLW